MWLDWVLSEKVVTLPWAWWLTLPAQARSYCCWPGPKPVPVFEETSNWTWFPLQNPFKTSSRTIEEIQNECLGKKQHRLSRLPANTSCFTWCIWVIIDLDIWCCHIPQCMCSLCINYLIIKSVLLMFARMNPQERSHFTWRVLMWWWLGSFSTTTGLRRRSFHVLFYYFKSMSWLCKVVLWLVFWVFLYQCGNMAREGLRVLVVAKKSLTEEQYQDFEVSFQRLVIRKLATEQNPGVNKCWYIGVLIWEFKDLAQKNMERKWWGRVIMQQLLWTAI